jgi:microcystin-dependent protein
MADFTNVEVTDTFDQWRIKTNQLGSDFIAFEAQVEEDIANIDLSGLAPLSHTHPINDIINLQSSLDSKANQSTTYTKTETDAKYVTLSTAQSVTGDKTFTKSLTASGGISSPSVNITGSASTNKLTITSGKMRLRNQDYTWPSSYTAGRYLKTDAQGNLSWEEVAGGTGDVNLSTLVFNDIVPVGTIIPWAATSLPADGKWKFCNGDEVSNTTYPQIAALLGNRYGTAASGKTKLPNFAGRVPLGAGGAFSVGGTGGSANITGTTAGHTLTIDQIPSHSHTLNTDANYGYKDAITQPAKYITGQSETSPIGPADSTLNNQNYINTSGGGLAHSHSISLTNANYQPYLTTQYIIKVLPDDVQQVSINAGNGINVKNASNQDTTTLDLFSTKIELKADTSQFKFSASGLLQLVTPVVSQASITNQINTAVSGLATEAYVDDNGITQTTGTAPYYGCRAFAVFNGQSSTITPQSSGNVASITRTSTGTFKVTFTTAMPIANYSVVVTANHHSYSTYSTNENIRDRTTSGFTVYCGGSSGLYNPDYISFVVFA